MAIVPGSRHLDLKKLKDALRARNVQLMTEDDLANSFPDCEVGAMPPFGALYGVPVYVDEHLSHEATIAFNAGSHHELIRLPFRDFERLQHVKTLHIAALTPVERLEEDRLGVGPYSHL